MHRTSPVGRARMILEKPWYVLRPDQVVRRFMARGDMRMLPWGLPLRLDPDDVIGASVVRTGVYDLAMTEALFRLTEVGDVCVDAGANIGYASSVMAYRAGTRGHVYAIEPNPALLPLLQANVAAWAHCGAATVTVLAMAASTQRGQARFRLPDANDRNAGAGTLEASSESGHQWISVETAPLQDMVRTCSVLKLDVEGHELAVLEGSKAMFERGDVRDVVFEEQAEPPTPVTDWFAAMGYRIFRLDERLLGPRLSAPLASPPQWRWHPPNYLATRDFGRSERLFRRPGWRCLRPRRRC